MLLDAGRLVLVTNPTYQKPVILLDFVLIGTLQTGVFEKKFGGTDRDRTDGLLIHTTIVFTTIISDLGVSC